MPGTGYAYMKYYVDPGFDSGDYLDGKYNFGIGLSQGELNNLLKGYLFDRVYKYSLQRDMDDYKLVDNLSAGYIMTEINLGRLIMLLPGVRYELTNIDATGKVGTVNSLDDEGFLDDQRVQDTTATIRYSRWFPMVHLRIRPADWFDIRLAYTNAISYPRMDYIIPAKKIKASEVTVVYGRPDLKPQLSTNYDAYLSVYANKVGLLTAGAFYKKIDNLIYLRTGHIILDPVKEGVENNLRGYYITQPENNPLKTTLYGFEFEWQTNFKWLPSPFDGIVINANYSHIWSETRFPRSFVKQERIPVFPYLLTTVIDTFRVGKMPDQASDIANFSFGYDLGKFSGRVSMLLQGKTLSFVGVREELDGFTDDYIRWDMSLKYDLWESFGIFANVNNITNEADESHMQTARYATGREFYGWTADFGFSWKF
jgi:TonB-dependent receptor